jgi:hypothetical protein
VRCFKQAPAVVNPVMTQHHAFRRLHPDIGGGSEQRTSERGWRVTRSSTRAWVHPILTAPIGRA